MTKVNLIHGEGDVLDTHLNKNPFTKKTEDGLLVRGDLTNIDKYVDELNDLWDKASVEMLENAKKDGIYPYDSLKS